MNKLILITLFFLNSFAYSQSGWFWINPQPQGNGIYVVKFINDNTAFAVGSVGTILKTTNTGSNWHRVNSNLLFG